MEGNFWRVSDEFDRFSTVRSDLLCGAKEEDGRREKRKKREKTKHDSEINRCPDEIEEFRLSTHILSSTDECSLSSSVVSPILIPSTLLIHHSIRKKKSPPLNSDPPLSPPVLVLENTGCRILSLHLWSGESVPLSSLPASMNEFI